MEEEEDLNSPATSREPIVQINPADLIGDEINLEEMKRKFGIEFVILNKEKTEHFDEPSKTVGCQCSAQKFYEKYYNRIVQQMQIYDEIDDSRTKSVLTLPPADFFSESYVDERILGVTESGWFEGGFQVLKREDSEEFEILGRVISYDDDFEGWSDSTAETNKVRSKPSDEFDDRSVRRRRKKVRETPESHAGETDYFHKSGGFVKAPSGVISEMINKLEESLEGSEEDRNWPTVSSFYRPVRAGRDIFKNVRGVSFPDDYSEILSPASPACSEREADYDYIRRYMERCLNENDLEEETEMGCRSSATKHPPSLTSWGEEEEILKGKSGAGHLSISEKCARNYMKEHRMDAVFKYLCAHLLVHLPENPIAFLILLLDKCMCYRRTNRNPPLLFHKRHVESLFKSMDPMGYNVIDINQYNAGMFTLGLRNYSSPVKNEEKFVTKEFFVREAMRILKSNLDDIIYDHSVRYNVSISNE